MGADFIGGFCPIVKTREEALAALREMPDSVVFAEVESVYYFADDFDAEEDEDYQAELFAEARGMAEDDVNAVYDALEHAARDCGVWTIEGTNYIVTGGMSWGDPPTDMCNPIWCVSGLGVTK